MGIRIAHIDDGGIKAIDTETGNPLKGVYQIDISVKTDMLVEATLHCFVEGFDVGEIHDRDIKYILQKN